MSEMTVDLDSLMELVAKEARGEYGDMLKKLRDDQKKLFLDIVQNLQREYLKATLGPEEEKEGHLENLRSLRNALSAIEGIVAIRVYRTTINIIGRVIWAVLKATAKAAIA
jgi:hypothetical protein